MRPSRSSGLVGGIGAGKSLAAALFAERGAKVIDADALGHAALRQPAIRSQVQSRWGAEIMDDKGEVNRRKLGAIVFDSAEERAALQAMVFPWIDRRIREEIAQAEADSSRASDRSRRCDHAGNRLGQGLLSGGFCRCSPRKSARSPGQESGLEWSGINGPGTGPNGPRTKACPCRRCAVERWFARGFGSTNRLLVWGQLCFVCMRVEFWKLCSRPGFI